MKILVPVDGSAESLAAVRHALALVREGLRASLLLVNVQEPAGLYELLRVHDADAIETIAREAGAHGKGESEGRRLGSVAHALLHDASLPVTVVRSAP